MADRYATNYDALVNNGELVEVLHNHGRVRSLFDSYSVVGATDAINDRLFFARLPSACRILPDSTIYHDGITGLTDVDVGDANDPNGLADAINLSSAGSALVLEQVDLANYGLRLWELLGYTEDPGGQIDLCMTFITEPTGSGDIVVDLRYVID